MPVNIKKLRARAWHSLSPQTAAAAGLTVEQMQQFVSGSYQPTSEQLEQLARRMGVSQ